MRKALPLMLCFMLVGLTGLRADEGMWTLDNLPHKQLKEKYNFTLSDEWVKTVQLSAVKLPRGSSTFLSPNGLIITNHHVASGLIYKLSSEEHDYIKNGFYAKTLKDELKCKDTEADVLVDIEDVTKRVLGAVAKKASEKEKGKQISAEISRIEKESSEKTGLKSRVIKFYQGGLYHLYKFKTYSDVRLVMAPEMAMGHFGGDYDNYTYPRFSLDYTFLRIYENGKPFNSQHHFTWSKNGASEGELVFMVGNPALTRRQQTLAQIEYDRDYYLANRLEFYHEITKYLNEYMSKSEEHKRKAMAIYSGIQNYIKRYGGEVNGLSDKNVIARKKVKEEKIIAKAKKDKKLKFAKNSWKIIEKALDKRKKIAKRERYTNHWYSSGGSVARLAQIAEIIVDYVDQVSKPNHERSPDYRDSALDTLHRRLFSTAPVYPDMDEFFLAKFLQLAKDKLGENDSYVKAALGDENPKILAKKLIRETGLLDIDYRKKLAFGGKKALENSKDPLIVWARKVAPIKKEITKWVTDNVTDVIDTESGKISKVRFAIYGKSIYPEATFTLRFNYGIVKGYEMGTTLVPYKTTFYSLFGRAAEFDYKEPFNLPSSFMKNRNRINMETPYNFVTTNDMVGGNSGSPIFNKNLEFVGIIFDGNVQSTIWPYAYTDNKARSISVHSDAILE
ncbi:MAG TPA: S46 family peptidase, partial [Elusimicrobiales bacterium]|nr:S46 family peptidase [Elusimicrobiales bacterium]